MLVVDSVVLMLLCGAFALPSSCFWSAPVRAAALWFLALLAAASIFTDHPEILMAEAVICGLDYLGRLALDCGTRHAIRRTARQRSPRVGAARIDALDNALL